MASSDARVHTHVEDAAWQLDDLRPDLLRGIYRYKTLLGRPGVPCPGASMGILELTRGTYPFHEHPAPEIYFILRGRAEWAVGRESFVAREGTAIYHAPGVRHRMVHRGREPLVAVWFWWAPGGRTGVLRASSRLSADPPAPRRAGARADRPVRVPAVAGRTRRKTG